MKSVLGLDELKLTKMSVSLMKLSCFEKNLIVFIISQTSPNNCSLSKGRTILKENLSEIGQSIQIKRQRKKDYQMSQPKQMKIF